MRTAETAARRPVRALLRVCILLPLVLGVPLGAGAGTVAERCRAEVVELHDFLEQWSNAELPATDEAFARFDRVIAPGFEIIGPDGERAGRDTIVEPGKIRIENFRFRLADGDLALATYEEWHEVGEPRGRLSTVLFGRDEAAPNGLVWLHLHEVWIEPEADRGGEGR